MCDDPGKDILEAKERLAALFGDLETYVEFTMKKQEKEIKQGGKKIRRFTNRPSQEAAKA